MDVYLFRLSLFFVFIGLPFVIMAFKGRKYARIETGVVKTILGGLLWFVLCSWTILGAGGHGFIAAPIPNIFAVPIWFFCSDNPDYIGIFNVPYMVLSKQAYWLFPLLHLCTFYLSYLMYRSCSSESV